LTRKYPTLTLCRLSGGGPATITALATGAEPPPAMWEAVLSVCEAASAQGTRIWTDAEQQDLQPTIDVWTTTLMRKYNKDRAMIYNTFQAYLKSTPANVLMHLRLAQEEGWVLGIKLVRGAYIATEQRDLIHDTIEDTHAAYDGIVKSLLTQDYPGISTTNGKPYPKATLFVASHNESSVQLAYRTQMSLLLAKKPTIEISYGQLQGMADELSCTLLQLCEKEGEVGNDKLRRLKPDAFKCLSWGTTQQCLQFLLRRVKENGDALGRTGEWVEGFESEIWRRVRVAFGFR
jgi:proline dehydrogenase